MSGQFPVKPSESKPVRLLYGIAAGAGAATTVLAAVPEVPRWVLIVVAGVGVVLTAALGRFTEQQVTPWAEVAARTSGVNPGTFVAGPASPVKTGAVVDVTADTGPVGLR